MIGSYDASAPPKSLQPTQRGFSVQAAIRAAEALAQKHQANIQHGGYPALVAAEAEAVRLAQVAEADASRAAEKVKIEAARYTLENLLDQYCDYLESLGRRSHKDARSIFKLHVNEAWPKISALPANQVTGEQVADMMRGLMEAGKGRTSNKLRSYIRAAYQVARAARSKASIPLAFKSFNVTVNPAADTEPDDAQNKADKNPLSADDMRAYWQIIKPMPGFVGAVLRLHLLTGGQRIEQLVNLKTADLNGDVITLMDGKGRPGKPARPHSVPLIPLAAAALAECRPKGAYAISTDGGVTHLSAITMSNWAVVAAAGIDGFAHQAHPLGCRDDAGRRQDPERPSRAPAVPRHQRRAEPALRRPRVHGREARRLEKAVHPAGSPQDRERGADSVGLTNARPGKLALVAV